MHALFLAEKPLYKMNFQENDKTFEFKKHVSTETSVIFS